MNEESKNDKQDEEFDALGESNNIEELASKKKKKKFMQMINLS